MTSRNERTSAGPKNRSSEFPTAWLDVLPTALNGAANFGVKKYRTNKWATTRENVPSDNSFNVRENKFELKE